MSISNERRFTRCGPVHFQSLEAELAPVVSYLRGNLLNAGCGNRDLRPWLAQNGAGEMTPYDLASDLPGAVLGPLEAMPFADASFDAILCNAVMEHVEGDLRSVGEMARVLKPGGHLVLAVPFLQPYHECPRDFRRYTREGLVTLGESAGLKAVAINPVHSAAQTIGWILWEIAQEKGRLWRAVTWPIVFLWTRFSIRTDPALQRNANTYQIVFQRPSR